jgi:hypothetical protein
VAFASRLYDDDRLSQTTSHVEIYALLAAIGVTEFQLRFSRRAVRRESRGHQRRRGDFGLVHSTRAIVTVYFLPSFKVMTNLASS